MVGGRALAPSRTLGIAGQARRAYSTQPGRRRRGGHALPERLEARTIPGSPVGWSQRVRRAEPGSLGRGLPLRDTSSVQAWGQAAQWEVAEGLSLQLG